MSVRGERTGAAVFLVGCGGIVVAVAVTWAVDFDRYQRLLLENGPLESATALSLLLAGLVAAVLVWRAWQRRASRLTRGLLLVLAGVCVLGALEEVSWGQSLARWRTPTFFAQHSDQHETNLHNLTQQQLRDAGVPIYTTKQWAVIVLGLYGIALPAALRLWRSPRAEALRRHPLVPPLWMAPVFFVGGLFGLDRPTGREEEIAELLFALCLLAITARAAAMMPRVRPAAAPATAAMPAAGRPAQPSYKSAGSPAAAPRARRSRQPAAADR